MTGIASAGPSVNSFLTPFGAIFAVIGLIFVLIGVGMAASGRRFRRRAERAEGTIVGMKATDVSTGRGGFGGSFGPDAAQTAGSGFAPASSTAGGFVYRPTVVFTTRDGHEVRATSRIGGNPRPGRIGQTVRVLYDPQNPQHVQVDSFRGRATCLEVAFMLIGGVFTAFGVAVLVLAGH